MSTRTSDMTGDAMPAEEPQAAADRAHDLPRPDYLVADEADPDEYHWALTGALVNVGTEPHQILFDEMHHDAPKSPHAYGDLHVYANWEAVWSIEHANMALHTVEKRLKRFCRDHGWKFGGMLSSEGNPFEGESLNNKVSSALGEDSNGIKDWRSTDWGEDIHQVDYYGIQSPKDETNPETPLACSECDEILPDYDTWRQHVVRNHVNKDRKPTRGPVPVIDYDDPLPANLNTNIMDTTVMRQAAFARIVQAKPKVDIPGPIPFVYDIEQDRIFVGHPGERHADIKGRFTPGGVVEGVYDPKGNVQIRTDTDMPYTLNHMVRLWYAMHPELEVGGVFLLVGEKRYKLSSANIGHKVRNIAAADPAAWAAYEALAPHGNVFVVGGAVRDLVLGKVPKDVDLMVQGIEGDDVSDILSALPGRMDFTGKSFGVFRYRDPDGYEVEIALPRTESSTGDTRKEFDVVTDPFLPVEKDLDRRDFTANAMAVNLKTGELIDPHRGADHLQSRKLETVSDRSFLEDPTRMLRALGSVSRHGLEPSSTVKQQMAEHAHRLASEPGERLQMELDKILDGDEPERAMRLAMDTGLMHYVLPEVAATKDFDQENRHHNKVLHDHLLSVLDHTTEVSSDKDLRLAALLHDIGKPASKWLDAEGNGHYYHDKESGLGQDHEVVGANMTREVMERLRYPKARVDRVSHLVRHHMFPAFSSMGGARKFINRVGEEHADDLLRLRHADNGGKDKGHERDSSLRLMAQYVQRVREAKDPTDKSQLAITGRDLINAGMKPGPQMGSVFDYLVQWVLEDPSRNQPDLLVAEALRVGEQPDFTMDHSAKTANILDPIHDALDPDVFEREDDDAPIVKPYIVSWVRRNVFRVMREAGWPDPTQYLSLVLTGSLTTYQWSEASDFDVSLFVDTESFPDWVRADLIKLMIDNLDGEMVPGTTHPLQVFVVPPEVTREKLYQPGLRSAYDLDEDEWIILPERDRSLDVHAMWPEYIVYAKMVEDKMRMMLKYNKHGVEVYWHFLHDQRRRDMKEGKGDYSQSNIVYKWLANRGVFDEISAATGEYIA